MYELMLRELEHRRCAHVEKFPPYFIASIGAHLFNTVNRVKRIYFEAGRLMDTRLHIMFVAPPGFSKTFWLEQFLRKGFGLLDDTFINTAFEGYMSEAGWVGTIRFGNGGEPAVVKGAAWTHRYSIIGVEEFSAISESMTSSHSRQLDTAMLTSLDSGWVYKRLAAGSINYQTGATMWTGTQPQRFDLTSGLGRRFLFLQFIPTKKDRDMLTQRRREAKGITPDMKQLAAIKRGFQNIRMKLDDLKKIVFDRAIYDYLEKYRIPHYEEPLYERMLLGIALIRDEWKTVIRVGVDELGKMLVRQEAFWRDEIRRGTEQAEVLTILRDNEGKMKRKDLITELCYLGMDWERGEQVLKMLSRYGAIKFVSDEVWIKR